MQMRVDYLRGLRASNDRNGSTHRCE